MTRRVSGLTLVGLVVAVLASVLSASPASKPRVVKRAFTGTYIEDIDIVTKGRFANFLIAVQNGGVYGAPLDFRGRDDEHGRHDADRDDDRDDDRDHRGLRQIVDLRGVMSGEPRGIAYLESEHAIVAVDGAACDALFFFDADSGRFTGKRTLQRATTYAPDYCEGLAAIPRSAHQFGGDLLLVAMDTPADAEHVEVVRPDGRVVQEIIPPSSAQSYDIAAVAFQKPDRMLISVNYADGSPGQVWTLNLGGVEQAPRVTFTDGFLEGIAQAADGRIFVTRSPAEIDAFDASFQPIPSDNRSYELGLGLVLPIGAAWNSSTGRLIVNATDGVSLAQGPVLRTVQALSPSLDSASPVVDFALNAIVRPQGMTFLPSEGLLAVANSKGPAMNWGAYLFTGGTPAGQVPFGAPAERPLKLAYLPATSEFALRTFADDTAIRIYSRTGQFVRQFDPRPPGVASVGSFTSFVAPDGAERLLFLMSGDEAVVTDLFGSPISTFNWRTSLGLIEPSDAAFITSGAYAGALAVTESGPSSVTIFRLP